MAMIEDKPLQGIQKDKIRKRTLKEIFGTLNGWKINSQKLKDELRKEQR